MNQQSLSSSKPWTPMPPAKHLGEMASLLKYSSAAERPLLLSCTRSYPSAGKKQKFPKTWGTLTSSLLTKTKVTEVTATTTVASPSTSILAPTLFGNHSLQLLYAEAHLRKCSKGIPVFTRSEGKFFNHSKLRSKSKVHFRCLWEFLSLVAMWSSLTQPKILSNSWLSSARPVKSPALPSAWRRHKSWHKMQSSNLISAFPVTNWT